MIFFLNLPKEIMFMDGSYIHYTYDAAGTLLRKGYYVGEELTEIPGDDEEELTGFCLPDTHLMSVGDEEEEELVEEEIPYTDVTDYSGNCVYENGTLKTILIEGGYITFDSSNQPVYHFYLKDHLGNNRVVANASGQAEQVNHYYPYGGLMAESTCGDVQRYKYNGKELDRMLGLDWYDYGARHYDGALTMWGTMDPLCEKYYNISPYVYCGNNPINAFDPDGRDVWLFATKLPGTIPGTDMKVPFATHTFLVVTGDDGNVLRYAAYGPQNGNPIGGDKLTECHYQQDQQVYTDYFKGKENSNLKGNPQKVKVPQGMTSNEFDKKVIQTINSFGNKDGITYSILGGGNDQTSGNCNTSSSTVLIKSGVGEEEMKSLERNIKGINSGFQTTVPKPWTKKEQEKALEERKRIDESNRLKAL